MADEKKIQEKKDASGLTITLSVLGGVVLGALAVWGLYAFGSSSSRVSDEMKSASGGTNDGIIESSMNVSSSSQSSSASSQMDSSMLAISNQSAGLQVAVSHVVLPYAGWVVIHEDRDGVPGNALGAARVIDGRESLTVDLLRGTLPGKTYYGLLYRDDGDKLFSLDNDFPIRDEKGNPVMVRFMTN